MKRITDKVITEWARSHKIGTKIFGLTLSQYLQDDNANVYIAVPLREVIEKDLEAQDEANN